MCEVGSRKWHDPGRLVVMVRSDWSKRWPDAARFQPADGKFPGVSLDALKLLHLERKILLHGHEPIDTDSTPTLIGEDWLMNNGYMQAEGVANLDQVPATGALVAIGFPRLKGGTGGFASFTAICPPEWTHGVRAGDGAETPLPVQRPAAGVERQHGHARAHRALRQAEGETQFQSEVVEIVQGPCTRPTATLQVRRALTRHDPCACDRIDFDGHDSMRSTIGCAAGSPAIAASSRSPAPAAALRPASPTTATTRASGSGGRRS